MCVHCMHRYTHPVCVTGRADINTTRLPTTLHLHFWRQGPEPGAHCLDLAVSTLPSRVPRLQTGTASSAFKQRQGSWTRVLVSISKLSLPHTLSLQKEKGSRVPATAQPDTSIRNKCLSWVLHTYSPNTWKGEAEGS